jgi:hypothetical protein
MALHCGEVWREGGVGGRGKLGGGGRGGGLSAGGQGGRGHGCGGRGSGGGGGGGDGFHEVWHTENIIGITSYGFELMRLYSVKNNLS